MTLLEIFLIGIGLSMDAATVSLTNGMLFPWLSWRKRLLIPLLFGLFQGLMPLLGYWAGSLFAHVISQYSGVTVFLILGIIGLKMFKEGFGPKAESRPCETLTLRLILLQAIATSIDAFAVGISFSAVGIAILPAIALIMATTFILSATSLRFGASAGRLLGYKANWLGGAILIILAFRALLD